MATIVYLDAEDEITTAATRIRQADDDRVALVVPFGSRVATSRINFRLLAREATANGRRLDIVAPDASARALAASAGIPVFGSVGEYEAALDQPDDEGNIGVPVAVVGAGAAGSVGAAAVAGFASTSRPDPGAVPDPGVADEREAELDAVVHRGRDVPVVKARRRAPRAGLVAGLLILAGSLVAAGAAAFLFLPTAQISVTPRIEPVGPVDLTVRADPAVTAVDEDAMVIPAQTITIPVEVSSDFAATGKRTETTAATGGVRWRNCDPSASYTIPDGTIVKTAGGIAFTVDESVFLPVAVISGSGTNVNLRCTNSEVAVTAVKPGPAGNVDAGTIRVVPARYNRTLITVTNPSPTTGGAKEEFTRVSTKDVEDALATLQADLAAQFEVEVANPDRVPPASTAFPETAVLGEATPTVDPTTLVNQEVDTFALGLAADGTVLAVDEGPVATIAEAALADAVTPGYELVEGSTVVTVGEGTVTGDVVSFPVSGTAKQVRPVDGATLLPMVLGLSEADARALLEPYGDVEIVLWPDWSGSVPSFEQRVTLVVVDPLAAGSSASPRRSAAGSPSAGQDGIPSERLPSG